MANFAFDYDIIQGEGMLNDDEKELFQRAEAQIEEAYAPYSNFFVAAAILLDNGKIVCGTNQENASYGLSMCAERVALYTAASLFPGRKPVKMAIIARSNGKKIEKAIPPCGACRQVILEYENKFQQDLVILLKDDMGRYYRFSNSRLLLPLAFDNSYLNHPK